MLRHDTRRNRKTSLPFARLLERGKLPWGWLLTARLFAGLVASLAHPGGNVTGFSNVASDIIRKRLELLNEAVPKLSRVTVFVVEVQQRNPVLMKEIQGIAQALGLQLQILTLREAKDIERAFQSASKNGAGGIIAEANPVLLSHRTMVSDFAVKRRIPVIYNREEYIGAGGLTVYAASIEDLSRRAAKYVDKILKGANPPIFRSSNQGSSSW